MSIINTFDRLSEEIIKATDIVAPIDNFPRIAVVTFKDQIVNLARNMAGTEQLCTMNAGFDIPVYKIVYRGKELAFYQTILGGAASAGLLEEMIARGVEKFIFFGSCGTLDDQLAAGHLIVPTAAYRDEGGSYHYAPAGDYLPVNTSARLAKILAELGLPYVEGKTWTTDAFYRETRNNMAARKNEGCLTVEMECASIMAAGQFRNTEVYQYLYTEDSLDGKAWDPRTMGKVPESSYEKYFRIALEIALRL